MKLTVKLTELFFLTCRYLVINVYFSAKYSNMYTIQLKDSSFKVDLKGGDLKQGSVNGKKFKLDINTSDNEYHILYNNNSYKLELVDFIDNTKEVILKINNDKVTCKVSDELDLLLKQLGMDNLSAQKMNNVKAPMPGMVIDVLVDKGQAVVAGDTLLVLEAMKMENNIKAPADGIVKQVVCESGIAVEKNDILIVFE